MITAMRPVDLSVWISILNKHEIRFAHLVGLHHFYKKSSLRFTPAPVPPSPLSAHWRDAPQPAVLH